MLVISIRQLQVPYLRHPIISLSLGIWIFSITRQFSCYCFERARSKQEKQEEKLFYRNQNMERFHQVSGKLELISDSSIHDLCGIIMAPGIIFRVEFSLKPLKPNFTNGHLHLFWMLQVLRILKKNEFLQVLNRDSKPTMPITNLDLSASVFCLTVRIIIVWHQSLSRDKFIGLL